jgi:hypothetical protein
MSLSGDRDLCGRAVALSANVQLFDEYTALLDHEPLFHHGDDENLSRPANLGCLADLMIHRHTLDPDFFLQQPRGDGLRALINRGSDGDDASFDDTLVHTCPLFAERDACLARVVFHGSLLL